MIVITGAAGFIGSCLAQYLYRQGKQDLLLVDDFSKTNKAANLIGLESVQYKDRGVFLNWLTEEQPKLDWILHLGARTDTSEQDTALFDRLNVQYSQAIARYCSQAQVPLIYASSAATYGLGTLGYSDQLLPEQLQPLNPYGESKNQFDQWLLAQEQQPPFWAGLKFFNVYGPNEYHKGRMASVIFHTFRQIQATGGMKLFRSHHPDIADGQQQRDFIYIKDLLQIIDFLMQQQPNSAIYNVGTGQARSFWDLATQTFLALDLAPKVSFIDTPADIRATYQYFTEADMDKLRQAGYQQDFYSLEAGVQEYVQQYLKGNAYF